MTKVILEISDESDLHILLPLLERLGIHHQIADDPSPVLSEAEREVHYAIIDEGVPASDTESHLKDLEEARKDRPLPSRED